MDISLNFDFESNLPMVEAMLDQVKQNALRKIGFLVEGRAKLNAPVDTGVLRGSIRHNVNGDSVVIGTDVEYALVVEKGSSRHQAQPYLTPAVEDNVSLIKQIIESEYGTI